jgi:XPB/Ssl2-like helicase family protein
MPPKADEGDWSQRCRDAMSRYSAALVRGVAGKLVRPRANQSLDELIDKSIGMMTNPPVIDRRIRDLPEASRKLLALIGLSRQPRWKIGQLIALLSALGNDEGFKPIEDALKAGLLFPELGDSARPVEDFADWFGSAGGALTAELFAHPAVAARARGEDLGLPDLSAANSTTGRVADGLDWPLRLAALWQQVRSAPVRHTQANALFKKDLTRLQTDEVLSGHWASESNSTPELGVLALLLAAGTGLLADIDNELTAAPFPAMWEGSLPTLLAHLFAALPQVEAWDPLAGYAPFETGLSPTPTASFLILLLLAKAERTGWVETALIADWLWTHHPTWAGQIPNAEMGSRGERWVMNWLLAVAHPLQLIEVSGQVLRLSQLGRHLLGNAPAPPAEPAFPQTLLIQPNAEILAYRQGLAPSLIAMLSRFARWKGLGAACTLELTAEQIYRGLESGLTLPMIMQALARHSTRPVPAAVADLLQRWASKRERITVFSSAVLVEFATAAELDTAVNRGIVAIRLTDRIGMTADGSEPALTQLRLIANRDYEAKPQRCVTVGDDGVTLVVDAAAADLLLDAEIGRFAVPVASDPLGPRRYRVTPELLRRAAEASTLTDIDSWFIDRTGTSLSPAGRLFLVSPESFPPAVAVRLMIVRFPTVELANGAMQWPETRAYIVERLGPTSVVVEGENLDAFRRVLADVGVTVT